MVKNGGKIIAPVSVQHWALTSDMVFRAQDIHTYHKPYNTLRSILVHPKDRTPTEKKTGVVYDITCNDCGEHYIGETARTLEKRLSEHQKQTTSAIQGHQSQANHEIDWEGVKILDKVMSKDIRCQK